MPVVSSYLAIAIAITGTAALTTTTLRGLQTAMNGMNMSSLAPTASTPTSNEDYTCPVCGMSTKDMGYDNMNHIGFTNGQTIYTCGMAARSFGDYDMDLTDTVYLAANMAEFIVNSTAATAYAECKDSCEACNDGIKDLLTGDIVTTSNYQYVCLTNGQKLYFASTASKNEYLSKVNLKPRYLVNNTVCENEACPNAENIIVLSAAAKAFVPDLSTSSSSGSAVPVESSVAVSMNFDASLTVAVASGLAVLAAMA